MNCVFYVTDKDGKNDISYSHKMESERDIACQIAASLGKCIVKKYTEYDGELLEVNSVGIVFPSRSWGISFAVDEFLRHLRIGKNTYVYAVAAGEKATVDYNNYLMETKAVAQIKRTCRRSLGCKDSDIYIRSVDRTRMLKDTEYNMFSSSSLYDDIRYIMNGLLYHSLSELEDSAVIEAAQNVSRKIFDINAGFAKSVSEKTHTRYKLSNIFLDDDIFAEDKLCRVI